MAVWRMEDDCMASRPRYRVEYVGPNPFRVVTALKEVFKQVLGADTKDIFERDFRWDITSDPRGFYTRYVVAIGRDANTQLLFEVSMQGFQPADPNKDGKIVMNIGGRAITEWDIDSPFKRTALYSGVKKMGGLVEVGGLLWIYHKLFYGDVRRGHMRWCSEKCEEIWIRLRRVLNLPVPEKTL
jgi:hypothetical protein